MSWRGLMITCSLILLSFSASLGYAQNPPLNVMPFGFWLQEFRNEASDRGIPAHVLDDALQGLAPDETVVTLDRKQPEDKVTFTQYLANTVTPGRVAKGRELWEEYRPLLTEIGKHYQVDPRYILALWGIETSYGANKGNFSLIQSLATLAYEGRRAEFFREELMAALTIMKNEGMLGASLTSSWAGAMGHCQFMPSSYLKYAVDWDKDGHPDIWNSMPDVFASIANYLRESGWNGNYSWGRPVRVPADLSVSEADINTPRALREWAARGVTRVDGRPLSKHDMKAWVIYPGQPGEGAYLITSNYKVLLQWNRSRYFATAVGTLADRIAGEAQ